MDRLKFRLYDKDSGSTKEYSLSKLINTSYRRDKFEFRGRGTGLEDKNGKFIYEGDVVLLDEFPNPANIIYSEKQFGFFFRYGIGNSIHREPLENISTCEIIGNVFLKTKKDI